MDKPCLPTHLSVDSFQNLILKHELTIQHHWTFGKSLQKKNDQNKKKNTEIKNDEEGMILRVLGENRYHRDQKKA